MMRKQLIYLILTSIILSCDKDSVDTNRYLKIFQTFDNESLEAIQQEDNKIYILNNHLKRGESNSDYSGTDWNIKLQKYDSKGNLLDEKVIENPYAMDVARDLCFTQDDNILITGTIQDTPEFFYEQIRIVKTTKQFGIIWAKTYGHVNSTEEGNGIVESGSHDIYVAGDGYDGAFLFKLNAQGDSLWTKVYDDMRLNVICETSSGDILLGGRTFNTNNDFLYKADSTGELIWKKGISEIDWPDGYGYATICYSIIQLAENRFIISGFTSNNASSNGNFIIEMDSDGNVSFINVVEGGTHWLSKQISATKQDGFYYLMGYYYGSGDEEGMQLVKIGASGDLVWRKEFKDFIPNGTIIIENNNRLILAGEIGEISNRDIYLLKLDFNGQYE